MNGPGREDLLQFIEREGGRRPAFAQEADILRALSLDGDAALGFMERFSNAFRVDLTGYDPRYHHLDQGRLARPGWPFAPPPVFGVRLPIALSTLVHAAQSGHWPVRYPLLTSARSQQWLNVPLILIALPALAALVVAVLRGG